MRCALPSANPYPHQDPLNVSSTLFTAAALTFAGEDTFMAKWNKRLPKLPIKYEYIGMYNYNAKIRTARYLKFGGNVLGGAGYVASGYDYFSSMRTGDYSGARKAGIDGLMGAVMFYFPVGTVLGGAGLYLNHSYHSD